jgi:hypothetical protein
LAIVCNFWQFCRDRVNLEQNIIKYLSLPTFEPTNCLGTCNGKIVQENGILGQKTQFSRKSDRIFAKFPGLYPRKLDFAKNFFHNFCDFPQLYDFREKNISMILSAKIGFRKKLFSQFLRLVVFMRKSAFFAKIDVFAKNGVFCKNT